MAGQDHGPLRLGVGVADGQTDGEPVHLAIRQELGTGGPHGVLGGNDRKGAGQGVTDTVYGDLPLLHGLQQGGLGPGGGSVQLVRQK